MTMFDARLLSDKSAGFFYIPAAALGYIYSLNQNRLYLILALITLVSATFQHGFIRSVYGPKGLDRDPLRREEVYKRMQAAIWDEGYADDYPESLIQGVSNSENWSLTRCFVLLLAALSMLGVIIGYFISLIYLFNIVDEIDYIGIVLLFLLLLWLLQTVLWIPWSSVYLTEQTKEERPDHSEYIQDEMERLAYFVQHETDLHAANVRYRPIDGGTFQLEFDSDGNLEEVNGEEMEVIIQGFVAFQNRVDVPMRRLEGFIKYGGRDAHRFVIESDWVSAYTEGEIEYTEYREQVLETTESGKVQTSSL